MGCGTKCTLHLNLDKIRMVYRYIGIVIYYLQINSTNTMRTTIVGLEDLMAKLVLQSFKCSQLTAL